MLDKITDYIYGRMPGILALPVLLVCAVPFLVFLILLNIKKLHKPINDWD